MAAQAQRPGGRLSSIAVALILLTLISGCGFFGRDKTVLPPAELVSFQPSLKLNRLWSVDVGKGDEEARLALEPALLDDRLIVASQRGTVRALSLERGRTVWEQKLELPISGAVAADDEIVVVGTLDGDVVALNSQTGAEQWRATASSEILAPAALGSDSVIIRSQDGRVFGFDRDDGRRRWVFDQSTPTLTLRGNSAPALGGGFIFVGFDNGKLVALRERDGSVAWETTIGVPSGRSELDRMVDLDGQLAVVGRDLYAVGFQGRLMGLSADAGRQAWTKDFSSSTGVAVLRRQLFVADADDAVWAMDRFNGGTLWKQDQLARRQLTAPAPQGAHILVGDLEGYLHWLSAEDGSFVARTRVGNEAVVVTPIVSGDVVYVLTQGGRLSAIRAG